MARHDQQLEKRHMICSNCNNGFCGGCVDILRLAYTNQPICTCRKEDHFKGIEAAKEARDGSGVPILPPGREPS